MALGLMVLAILGLLAFHPLLAFSPIGLVVQSAALGLMVWARLVFGRRSFMRAQTRRRAGSLRAVRMR
jgi:hypothetical protein